MATIEKPTKYCWVCKYFDASRQQCKKEHTVFCDTKDFEPSYKSAICNALYDMWIKEIVPDDVLDTIEEYLHRIREKGS